MNNLERRIVRLEEVDQLREEYAEESDEAPGDA